MSKKRSISKTRAISLVQSSKGRFFTIGWTNKSGNTRVVNANAAKDTLTPQGYLRVKAVGKGWKSVDSRTINMLKINGVHYSVRK